MARSTRFSNSKSTVAKSNKHAPNTYDSSSEHIRLTRKNISRTHSDSPLKVGPLKVGENKIENSLNGFARPEKKIKAKRRLKVNDSVSCRPGSDNQFKNSINDLQSDLHRHHLPDVTQSPKLPSLSSTECQADYEEFVRAFAVPTHLYRYLASRHRSRPIYLNRNLRYMKSCLQSVKRNNDRKIETAVSKILSTYRNAKKCDMHSASPFRSRRTSKSSISASPIANPSGTEFTSMMQWPDEVEIIVDGFFDSEKENEWVTVEAKLTLQSRLGWAWRRKSRQQDTLVPLGYNVDCVCNPVSGISPSGSATCRFRVSDMLGAVGDSNPTNVYQRVNNAQLELRVVAKERRRAKRINGCAPGEVLSQASYAVHYSSAPLPLFYASSASTANTSTHLPQFLLSAGLYELRLGIQTDSYLVAPKNPTCAQLTSVEAESSMTLEGGAAANGGDRVEFLGGSVGSSFRFPKLSAAVDEYSRWPRLRFRVVWHNNNNNNAVITKSPRQRRNSSQRSPPPVSQKLASSKRPAGPCCSLEAPSDCEAIARTPKSLKPQDTPDLVAATPIYVTYRFLYGGDDKRLQQWSETQDMVCPWCKIDCRRGHVNSPCSLLAHLRSCHPRFRFKANWNPRREHLSLEVSLNNDYDGSNDCVLRSQSLGSAGVVPTSVDLCLMETAASQNPNQLPLVGGWTGYGGSLEDAMRDARNAVANALIKKHKPCKRLSYTHLIYWRGAESLAEHHPLEPISATRPLAVGHNRVYVHTSTMRPISAALFDDCDSESEDVPQWLRQHYQRKVEEFTDVNKGEKEMMQIWNAFLLSVKSANSVVCDSQMTNLVLAFVRTYGSWIHHRGLRNNLILHLTNLVDYGLASPILLRRAVCAFNLIMAGVGANENI